MSTVTANPVPLTQRLAVALPGAGALISGQPIAGVGMLALDGMLAWVAIAGFPRLHDLLWPSRDLSIPGVVAVASWCLLVVGSYGLAWRQSQPGVPSGGIRSGRDLFLRQFTRHRTGMLGLFGVVLLGALVLMAPLIAPFDPDAIDVGPGYMAPGWNVHDATMQLHWFGTDQHGRDLFSRVLFGGRIAEEILSSRRRA